MSSQHSSRSERWLRTDDPDPPLQAFRALMFSWFETETSESSHGVDPSSPSMGALYAMRTEQKTKDQYRSKINVLCSIVKASYDERFGVYVKSVEGNSTIDVGVDRLKRAGLDKEKEFWTTLLTEVATETRFARRSREGLHDEEEEEEDEEVLMNML